MEPPLTRRQFLSRLAGGFGSVALAGLMNENVQAEMVGALRQPHFKPRAKRIIFLFMSGGPSQLDTFDPKPALTKWNGKRLPILEQNTNKLLGKPRPLGNAFPSPWKFGKYGKSGLEVSELFPNVAQRVDDLCVLRSMCCDSFFHAQGTLEMMTGSGLFLRPSIGSWLLYGLGSENANMPGFIVLGDPIGGVDQVKVFGSAFLPASYQSTRLGNISEPLPNLRPSKPLNEQRAQLDLLKQLNEMHRNNRAEDSKLEARIQSFELAFRMQSQATEAFDISRETAQTNKLYGIDNKTTSDYGQKCLLARRLVERGVRYVVVNHRDWDQHGNLYKGHAKNAGEVDKPIAGLLQDLKQRGLLEDTLVIWGGEFGRTPNTEGKDGRDHNTSGFTMWLAGGGVKGGHIHGQTDEFGAFVTEGRIHTHDFHATLLHLMGLDHEKLTYRYAGRDYRLTDVHGNVVKEIMA
ncbi:MAG: DUF1501 domain-containing protein [Planctomycetia bacterium]|nr:DUF1501 domain-containing protein [Planctomycetia bacterium]